MNTKTKKKHVEAWRKSGLSMAAYCQANGLNYNQFTRWRKKVDAGDIAGLDRRQGRPIK
jgi:hypothetical protein